MSNTAFAEVEQEVRELKPELSRNGKTPKAKVKALPTPMFVDCLLEPTGWQSRQLRWTAILSLTMQLMALGILVLIPLMFLDALPPQQLVTFLVGPPPPPPPPPPTPVAAAPVKHMLGEIVSGRLVAPTKIPDRIRMIKDDEVPPAVGFGVVGGVTGGIVGGQLGGVLGGIISSTSTRAVIPTVAPPPKRLRISEGVSAGQLINRVQPEYPKIARDARIQGTVELSAWITKDGSIERLTVVNGHPMLVKAAVDAVKQWRWRPFKLNGEPVEVETRVTVVFSVSNGAS